MTNETTASQPKSIGDDAQFKILMERVWSEMENSVRSDSRNAWNSLVAYLDSRASAAQASATIQVAPELPPLPEPEEMDGARWGYTSDQMRAYGEDCLAATIQEPVMVAEPVGDTALGLLRVLWGDIRIRQLIRPSAANKIVAVLAAPMVADPAGVAVDFREKFKDAYDALKVAAFDSPFWNQSMEQLLSVIDSELTRRTALAVPVKAVPSEAQSCRVGVPRNMVEWAVRQVLDNLPALHPWLLPAAEDILRSEFQRAAPLADKTEGAA